MLNHLRDFFQKDARYFQIAALSFFLFYGILFLDWEAEATCFTTIIGTCLLVQSFWIWYTKRSWHGLKSAMISSLSLCLLLKINLIETALIAAFVTISSKFLIRTGNKHIFNPANFGIIACILLTGDAWVSPGQWGSDWIFWAFMGVAGLMVLWKVGRIDTSLAFLGTFFMLEFSRHILYKGWPMDYLLHEFSNGTLLLFTFFMITDPMTTPNAPRARLLWGATIAVVAFLLTSWFYVYTAPIWALIMVAPLTPVFDKLFIHQKFKWT